MKIAEGVFLALSVPIIGVALIGSIPAAQADENPPLGALGPPPVPPDNPMTPEKVELGKLLFFDTRLSGDASVACSTCHEPPQGWAFSNDISRGYPGTIHWRNSQTVVNAPTTASCSGPVLRSRWKARRLRRPKARSRATASLT